MSEDKRQSARTQGKYSNDKEGFHNRDKTKHKGKKSSKADKYTSEKGDKAVGQASGSKMQAEGASIEYQENSKVSFKDLEKKRYPEELRFKGFKEISKTDNGISSLIYEPEFLTKDVADNFMQILNDSTKWHEKNIIIHGQEFSQPRLVAWYGPLPYEYSGAVLEPAEMPQCVVDIKQKVEECLSKHNVCVDLNSVLLNLYRDGKDSVSWHSDDEWSMGICPTIASVSLGEVRKFEMRPKYATIKQENFDDDTVLYINLLPGSLIIMDGCMQKDWQHKVPKEFHDKGRRINLTFRTVYKIEHVPREMSHSLESSNPIASDINIKKEPLEPKYDYDNFPSLSSASSQKHKKYNKAKDHTESQSENESNGTPAYNETLMTPKAEPTDQDIEHNTFADPQSFNETNTTPEVTIDGSSQSETSQASNIKEEIDSNYVSPENEAASYESEEMIQNQNYSLNAGGFEQQMANSLVSSTLNANANEFIPFSANSSDIREDFKTDSLSSLARYYPDEMNVDELESFRLVMLEKLELERNGNLFSKRDWFELNLLCLVSDGTQTERNQKLILNRMCSMIMNAENYFQRQDYRYPYRNQGLKTYYRDNTGSYRYQANKKQPPRYQQQ